MRETNKVIEFIPYKRKKTKENGDNIPTASIDVKFGRLVLGKFLLQEYNWTGKWLKIYYEPTRKIIGWKIADNINQTVMKDWKFIKPNKTGTAQFGIRQMLQEFKRIDKSKNTQNLEVKKYVDRRSGYLETNETYYYVKLK